MKSKTKFVPSSNEMERNRKFHL